MATVTVLFSFYFFFASFVGVFRFFRWVGCKRAKGVAINAYAPETVRTFRGAREEYTYDVRLEGEDDAQIYKYTEIRSRNQEPQFLMNTPIEVRVSRRERRVILAADFARIKKKLYLNPLCFIGCMAASVLLMMMTDAIR